MESEKLAEQELLGSPNRSMTNHCFLAIENTDIFSLAGYMIIDPEPPIARCIASMRFLDNKLGPNIYKGFVKEAISYAENNSFNVLHTRTNATDLHLHKILKEYDMSLVRTEWIMNLDFDVEIKEQYPGPNFSLASFKVGSDEEILATLQNLCFEEHWGFSPNTRPQIEAQMKHPSSPPEGVLILKQNSFPVGYVWTEQKSSSEGILGQIGMLGVHPQMRGHGLGNYLMTQGIQFLKECGATSINLTVDSLNIPAWKIYQSIGFSKTAELHWHEKKLSPLDSGNTPKS